MKKHIKLVNDQNENGNLNPMKGCGWWSTDVCGVDISGCGNYSNDCCSVSDAGSCGWGSYDCTDTDGKS